MKVEPGQIWERDYSSDYHYLPVRVKILAIENDTIVSEVIYSATTMRIVGTILTAPLNGMDPYEYKTKFGWINQYNIN